MHEVFQILHYILTNGKEPTPFHLITQAVQFNTTVLHLLLKGLIRTKKDSGVPFDQALEQCLTDLPERSNSFVERSPKEGG